MLRYVVHILIKVLIDTVYTGFLYLL